METQNISDIAAAIDAGKQIARLEGPNRIEGGKPFILIPKDQKVEDIENLLPRPIRKRANITMVESESFVRYVNTHKTAASVIFAVINTSGAIFQAVIDYHAKEVSGADNCEHIARLALETTPEWRRWMDNNKKHMNQEDFAYFIETNEKLLIEPDGATLLELVENLVGKKDVRFDSAVRLQNGKVKLNYDEEIALKGTIGSQKGEIEIPSQLLAGIAPFRGETPYKSRARLRYRIESRKLSFWYEVIDPHLVVEDCVQTISAKVKDQTGISPYLGVKG